MAHEACWARAGLPPVEGHFGADVLGLPADCAAPELDRAVGSLPPSLAGDLWPGWHPASATASQATTSRAERSGRDQP